MRPAAASARLSAGGRPRRPPARAAACPFFFPSLFPVFLHGVLRFLERCRLADQRGLRRPAAALCASVIRPASKLGLWQLGLFMSQQLGVRGDGAAAGADRDERAVVALLPRRDDARSAAPPALRHASSPAVDVAGRLRASPAKPGRRRASRPGRSCGRAACGSRTGPCARRPRSGSRAAWSPPAGTTSSRRGSCRCRRRCETPMPADVMQAPLSGLPSAPTAVSGISPFGCAGLLGADDRLEGDLRELVARTPARAGNRAAPDSCRPSPRRSCRRSRSGTCRRPARMLRDDPVEGALAAAERPHPVVRVAVAVERDLDAVQPERREPVDHLRRQQQPVGDDVDHHLDAARGAAAPSSRSDR